MAVEIQNEEGTLLVTRVSGEFTASDLAKMEDAAIQVIEGKGNMKCLVLLSDFLGWAKSDVWGDVTFFGTFGTKIEKSLSLGIRNGEMRCSCLLAKEFAKRKSSSSKRLKRRPPVLG